MKWKKLGRIFDPTDFGLEFAQSPQVLVLGDRVRTYFSTRTRDSTGKYLSNIAYVDFDRQFKPLAVSSGTVLDLGKLGCFDEHGIFPLNVLRVRDKVFGYIGGWNRRVSVSVDGSIGLAISSDDGETFQRLGDGPILTTSLHEPFLIGDPFVREINGTFHMWYIFGTTWKKPSKDAAPERTYKIGHATSGDGVEWTKHEGRKLISDNLGEDESQALPTVAKVGDRWHMLFCYRQSVDFRKNSARGYRLGHACSDDLANWKRSDGDAGIDVSDGEWDSDMLCYPHLFEIDGQVYLMYNGNEFGRYGFGVARLEN